MGYEALGGPDVFFLGFYMKMIMHPTKSLWVMEGELISRRKKTIAMSEREAVIE